MSASLPFSSPYTLRLIVTGRVQGVGFRPFVYRLATESGMAGHVRNTPQGVEIVVQGQKDDLQTFPSRLTANLPPLAEITALHTEWIKDHQPIHDFSIIASTDGNSHQVSISPDIATCPDCLREINDPGDPRFMYPFTNCTNCGPRYTITRHIPYDRTSTSMACFPMCPSCFREYNDPRDRRFHAQPNACPVCGPRLWLAGPDGKTLSNGPDALKKAAQSLEHGNILAIKGLGGFHLACMALDASVVDRLRGRKNRPCKPLAVMVPDLETASLLADLSDQDRAWLSGRIKPIVIAPRRLDAGIPDTIAPDTQTIGIMLPYTPLHEILFRHLAATLPPPAVPALVMTSGNASNEPLALGNREARQQLHFIADLFVFHNRDILVRCDDSVIRNLPGREHPLLYRRSRGFAPAPIALSRSGPCVLGTGPDLKTTVCVTKGDQAFVSQHIGDLHNLQTFDAYVETVEHLQNILQATPQALVTDLHPDFMSTRYAREQSRLPIFSLQHHLAHLYAVLAENQHDQPALGLILDGTGLGEDGALWGGELMSVHPGRIEHSRLGHMSPIPLPGGEKAIREPWRTAQSFLSALDLTAPEGRDWPWRKDAAPASTVVGQMLEKGLNCPQTTSCGRLFDAVSAMLGLCTHIEYEGQAAIRLETIQDFTETSAYACPVLLDRDMHILDTVQLFAQAYADWQQKVGPGIISRRFHLGLGRGLAAWAKALAEQTGIRHIALSGGVFQNATLAAELPVLLHKQGLIPLQHCHLPPNDACISLGQAAYGRIKLANQEDGLEMS